MQRYSFFDIFQQNPDGSLTPRRMLEVNGIKFGPGVVIYPGVSFGGVDFYKYRSRNIAAEEVGEVLVIKGFYKD